MSYSLPPNFGFQQALEYSGITNADIQEMEQVRGHLHMMLQNCKGFSDQGDYDHATTTIAGEKQEISCSTV